MGKDKWRNMSVITFMIFIASLMNTLKTYQVLRSGMLEAKNGMIFKVVTIILALITIIAFAMKVKRYKQQNVKRSLH